MLIGLSVRGIWTGGLNRRRRPVAERKDDYAGPLLKDLNKLARLMAERAGQVDDADTLELLGRVRWFLKTRLTDAAKAGCHHCHEGERGTPCWWCGLKNRAT